MLCSDGMTCLSINLILRLSLYVVSCFIPSYLLQNIVVVFHESFSVGEGLHHQVSVYQSKKRRSFKVALQRQKQIYSICYRKQWFPWCIICRCIRFTKCLLIYSMQWQIFFILRIKWIYKTWTIVFLFSSQKIEWKQYVLGNTKCY